MDSRSYDGHMTSTERSDTEPIACALPDGDGAAQALEWDDLKPLATARERFHDGVAMTFPIDLAERVEDLAAREAECCGFLSITTTRSAAAVRLEITTDRPDARVVIDALAGTGGSEGQ